ncbi:F-box protein [Melia azedarach]|uniref:F-box protein n=1 Tax=Melia azedarach TaxID=155640 RepID=A0ACC1XR20_MELAZ|nr:F-box protein [Melia azedarach]
MGNFGFLNNDICFNVLSRLPTKDLLRLKCVCKLWCQLISDRIFRQVLSPRREPISGFFFLQKYHWYSDDIRTIGYISVERQSAGLCQPVFNFLPEDVKVLASCNGLICCRSSFLSQDPALYVCNPLSKEWIRVNWTKPDIVASIGLACDPCQDTTNSLNNFKLVSVQLVETCPEDPYFSFNIYSSITGLWVKSEEISSCGGNLYANKVIFVKGYLYWLSNIAEILEFDVENEISSLIAIPFPNLDMESDLLYAPCIGESNGQLHFILVSDDGLLHIWTLEDFGWNFKCSRSLEVIFEEHPSLRCKSDIMWLTEALAFKDGYLLMKDCSNIYLYNVETNKMDKVLPTSELHEYSFGSCSTALTYSMSLVPLNSA